MPLASNCPALDLTTASYSSYLQCIHNLQVKWDFMSCLFRVFEYVISSYMSTGFHKMPALSTALLSLVFFCYVSGFSLGCIQFS